MKKMTLILIGLFLTFLNGIAQPTFDLSGLISGNITSAVPADDEDWACITDQGELIYYYDEEYHNLSDEEVPILVVSNDYPNGKDSVLNSGDVTFQKIFGGDGYIWAITDRGLAITFSPKGYNFSHPIVNMPELDPGTPLLKINTIASTAPNEHAWFVGELYNDQKLVGALTHGIDELHESDEIRRAIDLNEIEGFSDSYSFSASHFNDYRRCYFAWDNDNQVIMTIDLGDVNYFVLPYSELPVQINEIQWMGSVGRMTYFDEIAYRLQNAFLYVLNGQNKIYKYWLRNPPISGSGNTNKGFGAVQFQNFNEVDTSNVHNSWTKWQELESDLIEENKDKLVRPFSITPYRYVYFGIKNEKQLLKYDQVYGDYCKVGLADILDANLKGLTLPNFGPLTDYDSYAYSDKTITLLTDVDERMCGPTVAAKHKTIPEFEVQTIRLSAERVKVSWDIKYDALKVYNMQGKLIDQINPKFKKGQQLLPLKMNQSYIITAIKEGRIVGSKIFL